jgi:hypothetical protein
VPKGVQVQVLSSALTVFASRPALEERAGNVLRALSTSPVLGPKMKLGVFFDKIMQIEPR